MKKKLFIISNESIHFQDGKFYCDNIDHKTTPEGLNKKFDISLFARKSNKNRSHEIKIKKIKIFSNIFSFISSLIDSTKEKNALAISSNQSQAVDSFDQVTKNFNETLEIMTSETPRPDFWGGYSFIPYYFEFWQGHENRLNKRHVFKQQDNQWTEQLLQP